MFVELDLSGQVEEALRYIEPRLVTKAVRATLMRAAKPVQEAVQRHAPVATGALEGAIRRTVEVKGDKAVCYVGLDLGWMSIRGRAQEYGNVRVNAQPFLAPAAKEQGTAAAEELRDYFEKRLAALARKGEK